MRVQEPIVHNWATPELADYLTRSPHIGRHECQRPSSGLLSIERVGGHL